MGHIVNASFPNSSRKCVIQRKDVDGIYGSVVEADFATVIKAMEIDLLRARLAAEGSPPARSVRASVAASSTVITALAVMVLSLVSVTVRVWSPGVRRVISPRPVSVKV
jgi:hypothetical protein